MTESRRLSLGTPFSGKVKIPMITIVYHPEFADHEYVVWADSPDIDGFSAAGSSIADVRELVNEYLIDHEADLATVVERMGDANFEPGFTIATLLVDGVAIDVSPRVELRSPGQRDRFVSEPTYDLQDA